MMSGMFRPFVSSLCSSSSPERPLAFIWFPASSANVCFLRYRIDTSQYETTEESRAFRQEYEQRRGKQDVALDEISKGLSTLKTIGEELGEELNKQQPLVDSVEDKVRHIGRSLVHAPAYCLLVCRILYI